MLVPTTRTKVFVDVNENGNFQAHNTAVKVEPIYRFLTKSLWVRNRTIHLKNHSIRNKKAVL